MGRTSRKRKGDSVSSDEEHLKKRNARSPSRDEPSGGNNGNEERQEFSESLSIAETNKIRASLGLAPLQEAENTVKDAEDGTEDKIYNEDGYEFRHRKAENLADAKHEQKMKEKLEVAKKKREVYGKVMAAKTLAESDEEDSATSWVEKMRQKDEERKKAEQRAKMFDDLDNELGVSSVIASAKAKKAKKPRGDTAGTGGLVIGHAKEVFMDTEASQILVLQDKGVLDDGDEVLINPNMLDNERHARNVELKKRKDHYRNYDEEVDEFGNPKNFGVLAKYDKDLDGEERKTFRLDEKGNVDVNDEKREFEMYKKLQLAGKRLESLEKPKLQVASDFYTQEEMIAFRKPKKSKSGKGRSRKALKASDLTPIESASDRGSRRGRNRDGDVEEEVEVKKEAQDVKMEDNTEEAVVDPRWKTAMRGAAVDAERLRNLQKSLARDDSDEDSDDETSRGVDLSGVVIDDEAQDELHSMLSKARKAKQEVNGTGEDDVGKRIQLMLSSHDVKMEVDDDALPQEKTGGLSIDATMEYCRQIGDVRTYGIGGNRDDSVDVSELKKEIKEEEEVDDGFDKWKQMKEEKEKKQKKKREKDEKNSRGGWTNAVDPTSSQIDSDDEKELAAAREKEWSSDEEEGDEEGGEKKKDYVNVLGKERDYTKGVGGMLRLAAQKGYLHDPNSGKYKGPNLDHLKNKFRTEIDGSKYDVEDKYSKKLERLGSTSGRGPVTSFPEKHDYKPDISIAYVDKQGREMDAKDSYRELSYKFHGRNPGKKQLEKRSNRRAKQERILQNTNFDTPLGTLEKQRKKQEALQTPYLVLSGSTDHSALKKE